MNQQKPVKKKSGIVKQIFLWLWRVVLVSLLAAALYFQAPWKVITLLLIFLLACTILPQKFRKWFWLSVGVTIIALIIWVFLPEDEQGWRPYTFDAELAAIEAARSIPESENAAVIYNQLLADYDANVFGHDFLDEEQDRLTRTQPWKNKDYPEIAKWLKSQKSTISKLMQAAKMEKCRFPINADMLSFNEATSRHSPMRHWARLLIRSANNDLGRRKVDKAIEKNLAVFGMANHQYQQPMLIDMLMGVGCEALAIRQFNSFVITGDATERRLEIIENAVKKVRFNWSSDFPPILRCEKLLAKNSFGMLYEVNPNGKVRFSYDPAAAIRATLPSMPLPNYWLKKLIKTNVILTWFYMPSNPQNMAEIIDDAYERHYAIAEAYYDWEKEPEQIKPKFKLNYSYFSRCLIYMLQPAYYNIHDLYLRLLTDRRACQIIIGLRRYKNQNSCWPETLDDIIDLVPAEVLVDALSGKAFVYKLTDDGFTLYSIGKNGIDENGERDTKSDGNEPCADDWLIWPRKTGDCSN